MIDLGVMPKKDSDSKLECSTCSTGNEDKKNEPCYPSFSIEGAENIDKLKDVLGDCKVGEEYTAVIKFRLNGIQDTKYTKSFGFDLIGIDEVEPEGEQDSAEEESYEKPSKSKAVDKAIAKKK